MKKVLAGLVIAATLTFPVMAAHNPTPSEGYRNYGQCRSALAKEQNEVRKEPGEYTAEQAADINGATCEEDMDGRFRIIF